ncbi:MAG: hypothetical protein FJX76_16220 [Armatimonadetes bacterium]|nr:hypothetical protein [Armatimonadota bacterium]
MVIVCVEAGGGVTDIAALRMGSSMAVTPITAAATMLPVVRPCAATSSVDEAVSGGGGNVVEDTVAESSITQGVATVSERQDPPGIPVVVALGIQGPLVPTSDIKTFHSAIELS